MKITQNTMNILSWQLSFQKYKSHIHCLSNKKLACVHVMTNSYYVATLMVETIDSSETMESIYKTTRVHIPEDHNLNSTKLTIFSEIENCKVTHNSETCVSEINLTVKSPSSCTRERHLFIYLFLLPTITLHEATAYSFICLDPDACYNYVLKYLSCLNKSSRCHFAKLIKKNVRKTFWVFWDVTSRRLLNSYWRFGRIAVPSSSGSNIPIKALLLLSKRRLTTSRHRAGSQNTRIVSSAAKKTSKLAK